MDKQLSIIDIFSGIGGMSKGFLDAGYQIHEAIDSECKNWKKDVKRSELNVFIEKMKKRNGRCKLGFFVAWNGVTSDFNKELLRITRGEEVVVLLTKEGILSAIKTGAITNYLQHEYSQALLR